MFSRVISPSLSPNTDHGDVQQALRILFFPPGWKEGSAQKQVRQWFQNYLGDGELAFFNSGRSALLALLKAFDIGEGDEVLVQAFTCVAVPNSVLWVGAKPVYVDIGANYNLDAADAEKKITKRTRAIVVQHTFGIPAQVNTLLALAKRHKLILIEDCAHALGATHKGKKLGTLGDAAFFSFGRDKVVSSVWGGAAYIKYQISNIKYQKKLREIEKKLLYPSHFWIFQQLLHPIAFSIILPLYDVGIGKLLLVILQRLKLLSIPVYAEEKRGMQPSDFPAKYPNALAMLLVNQLNKLEQFGKQRQDIAKYYWKALSWCFGITVLPLVDGASFLRYPMLVSDPEKMLRRAKEQGILLGNWYHNIVDPTGVDFAAIGYRVGLCPEAEKIAKHIINCPTTISRKEAEQVVSAIISSQYGDIVGLR